MPDNSEQHRHRCEVRHLLARAHREGDHWLEQYVHGWKRWKGSALQKDFWAQRKRGNKGSAGEWIEQQAAQPVVAPVEVAGLAAATGSGSLF